MSKKIAIKRLSSSDLTLFEFHFRHTSGTKQKAINLDRRVFIDEFYPDLTAGDEMAADLSVFGPGLESLHPLRRNIQKEDKNWRLGAQLICNPDQSPSRYDSLQRGDYAILEFFGDGRPNSIRVCLVAQADPVDTELHALLDAQFGADMSSARGMLVADEEELAQLVAESDLPPLHPARAFVSTSSMEDAVHGGIEGTEQLWNRRRRRPVGREELEDAKRRAEQTGRWGEELVNSYLGALADAGQVETFDWVADRDAVAPFDFTVRIAGVERELDVKSTVNDFETALHVSAAELSHMAQSCRPYELWRLYSVDATSARLRISGDVRCVATQILNSLGGLPAGVAVDGVSIRPEVLEFSEEFLIDRAEGYRDAEQEDEKYLGI